MKHEEAERLTRILCKMSEDHPPDLAEVDEIVRIIPVMTEQICRAVMFPAIIAALAEALVTVADDMVDLDPASDMSQEAGEKLKGAARWARAAIRSWASTTQ